MTKPAFTPGPWKAECVGIMGDYSNPDDVYEVVADSEFGGRICKYAKEGDASLIAAAPDLYEALAWTLGFIEDEKQRIGYNIGSAVHKKILRARAALRKADGDDNGL